ncbi:hypothetical protein H0H81_002193 [Sphagnurus paluster]|uniref:Pinin/SDK/MemA protein domain-containing protein n=1 Tax=Sphagnurus paluster TaxID=117069 RepID=A0A9P7KHV2_9AGAR|nr:hypothetical protein H0H81_002193 [Sphagnurus paluster]
MSSEQVQDAPKADLDDPQPPPTEPAAMAAANKKRPRLDLNALTGGGRERKRGKSMFGLLVGTLNKAKIEDKERNASEAAKKRQLIEQRLQNKLRKETDSVRRAEEAKKDKTTASRKEEDLQLKDSIIAEAAEKEWHAFHEERTLGIAEIDQLRQRVADEEARRKTEKSAEVDDVDMDAAPAPPPAPETSAGESPVDSAAGMDVDKGTHGEEQKDPVAITEPEKKEEPAPMQADDDDAVEY